MTEPSLPLATRVWFAFVCLFRVLFDGAFAARAFRAREPQLPTGPEPPVESQRVQPADDTSAALLLLGLLQREGRLVDFLQQDVSAFSDAEVGAAARVVHDGCRRALLQHATIVPVREEGEGSNITVTQGFDPEAIKLTGDVKGTAPYRGVLRHKGWRAEDLRLPQRVEGHDVKVLAPAEVEL